MAKYEKPVEKAMSGVSAAPLSEPKRKLKVGDAVMVKGQRGVIMEVPVLEPEFVAKHGQHYSVKLDSTYEPHDNGRGGIVYKCSKTGAVRDHQYDTLGCVPETDLS